MSRRKRGIRNLTPESISTISTESPSGANPNNYTLTQEEMAHDVVWDESPPQNAFDHFDFESSNVDDFASFNWTNPVASLKRFKSSESSTSPRSSSLSRGSDAFEALINSTDDIADSLSKPGIPSTIRNSLSFSGQEDAAATISSSFHQNIPTSFPQSAASRVSTVGTSAKEESQESSGSQPALHEVEVASFVLGTSSSSSATASFMDDNKQSHSSASSYHAASTSLSLTSSVCPPALAESVASIPKSSPHLKISSTMPPSPSGPVIECDEFDQLLAMAAMQTTSTQGNSGRRTATPTSTVRPDLTASEIARGNSSKPYLPPRQAYQPERSSVQSALPPRPIPSTHSNTQQQYQSQPQTQYPRPVPAQSGIPLQNAQSSYPPRPDKQMRPLLGPPRTISQSHQSQLPVVRSLPPRPTDKSPLGGPYATTLGRSQPRLTVENSPFAPIPQQYQTQQTQPSSTQHPLSRAHPVAGARPITHASSPHAQIPPTPTATTMTTAITVSETTNSYAPLAPQIPRHMSVALESVQPGRHDSRGFVTSSTQSTHQVLPVDVEGGMDELAEFDMIMAMASQVVSARKKQDHQVSAPVGLQVTYPANESNPSIEKEIPQATRATSEPVRSSDSTGHGNFETLSMDDYEAILKMEAAALASRGKSGDSKVSSVLAQKASNCRAMPGPIQTDKHEGTLVGEDIFSCHRFIALDVMDTRDDRQRRVKHILCYPAQSSTLIDSDEIENTITSVLLYDDWCDSTDISGGDIFHVIDMTKHDVEMDHNLSQRTGIRRDSSFCIDGSKGLIVMHPESLVTPTRIAESCLCIRRAVLSERVRGLDGGLSGTAAVMGNVKHLFVEKIFDMYLVKSKQDESDDGSSTFSSRVSKHNVSDIFKLIYQCISTHAEALSSVQVSDGTAFEEVNMLLTPLMEWISKCIPQQHHSLPPQLPPAMIKRHATVPATRPGGGMTVPSKSGDLEISIYEVLGIEETLNCAALGMKGQVDMIVEASVAGDEKSVVPIELKTGKWSPQGLITHRAQTILYILMLLMREKNFSSRDIPDDDEDARGRSYHKKMRQGSTKSLSKHRGLLLYLGAKDPSSGKLLPAKYELITPSWVEIKGLLQSRNKLATFDKKTINESISYALPPLLRNASSCEWCFKASECLSYHRIVEAGKEESSGVPDLFRHIASDISDAHAEYFLHWDTLIDLEASAEASNSRRIAWAELSSTSQSVERAHGVSGLRVISLSRPEDNIREEMVHGADEMPTTSGAKHDWILVLQNASFAAEWSSSLFRVGESVVLCVEFNAPSAVCDIEDCGMMPKGNISGLEPLIARGTISNESIGVSPGAVEVKLKEVSKRFARICQRAIKSRDGGHISVRVDRDEFQGSMAATLRSNILRLIAGSYDPQQYMARKKRQASHPILKSPHIKLRNLVISLLPPQFEDSSSILVGELAMFAPLNVDIKKYLGAVKILQNQSESKLTDVVYINGIAFYRGCFPHELLREYTSLNSDQQAAVLKILSAKDYVLLLGMPGTGKTSTISFVVRVMLGRGEKVLVTSYTHSAVDNLMEKLCAAGLSPQIMGRIGSETSVRALLHPYLLGAPDPSQDPRTLIASVSKRAQAIRIVGCTVLTAARHALLQTMTFDWCVTDESGQISQPASLGPLMLSSKFLLVGDDYQLPPIIQSLEAAAKGMDISLFKRLGETHPEAVVCLATQYRMNDQVVELCNSLIYEHRLSCGNEQVARARLKLISSPSSDTFDVFSWRSRAIDPSKSVIFLNTDRVNCRGVGANSGIDCNESTYLDTDTIPPVPMLKRLQSSSGGSRIDTSNEVEASVVYSLLKQLERCGVELSDVGVISPYRAQVRLIQALLSDKGLQAKAECEEEEDVACDAWEKGRAAGPLVSTVDKFQGRDMDVIIMSTVRNMQDKSIGDLLRDWRRVNVAITRARYKMIFVGSVHLMRTVPVLASLAEFCEDRNLIVDLPSDVMDELS